MDHEGIRQVVLYVPDKHLCGQNIVLLQPTLCYVRFSTSSVTPTFESVAMSPYHIIAFEWWELYGSRVCRVLKSYSGSGTGVTSGWSVLAVKDSTHQENQVALE